MQAYFNPTRRNMNKQKIRLTALNRVKLKTSNSASRQPRKLKFGIQAYYNPTRRNMNKQKIKRF